MEPTTSLADRFGASGRAGFVSAALERVRARLSPSLVKRLSIGVFLVFVLATTIVGIVRPECNWDMAPYIAASLEDRISDPVALHREAFAEIEARASAQEWFHLTKSNPYNIDMYADAAHFHSQLPMYRVKIGYIWAIRMLDRVTDPVNATTIISGVSALAIGLLMVFWMVRHDFAEGALLLLPVAMIAGYFNLALLATPDIAMAAFGLVGIYLIVKGRPFASVPLLLLMYGVRPDGIVFLFALLLAALAFGYARLPMLIAFFVALALYEPIAAAAGHSGWWPHYYFSNIALQVQMDGFSPAFTVTDYLRGIMRGVSVSLRWNNWPMVMMLLVIGWAVLAHAGRIMDRRALMMQTAILLCLVGKFVSFPLPDDRVYFMFVIAFAMNVLEVWKPRLSLALPIDVAPGNGAAASPKMSQKG